mmetsp:Transcript_10509/g.28765  ORF Transcript_10509/g.28765 Transcript_10509/m.28765 type:complete len:246 (-) Transcript_10509:679-1416(-)
MYEQEESIYSLLPPQQEVPARPPRHRSKFTGKVDPKTFEFGQDKSLLHATFGLPNGFNAQPPNQFLRSYERAPVLPDPKPVTAKKEKVKPPVPKRDEQPVFGLQSNKNFITTNAVENILAKPKNVPQEPFRWTSRPGYGKPPVYLRRNKQRIAAEREHLETYLKMRFDPDPGAMVTQLSEDERQELLRHLKRKWASVNTAYQKQPLSMDSDQKKHRKEEIERLLAEIEKDIKTLERGDMILIMDE